MTVTDKLVPDLTRRTASRPRERHKRVPSTAARVLYTATAWLAITLLVLTGASISSLSSAQDQPDVSKAPVIPSVFIDTDGTVHVGPRTIPPPTLMSAEAKKIYA